jgi:AraC family transcriptional activator of mtrCDE
MLSALLNTFRLQAQVYSTYQFCGNWQVNAHAIGQTCFHMVTTGRCQMKMTGHKPVILELGDLVVFPRELVHQLVPLEDELKPMIYQPMEIIAPNDAVPGTAILCGALIFEHTGFNHVLDALPSVFVIQAKDAHWIQPLLSQIRFEMNERQTGSDNIINRLSELLFVYALRHQIGLHKEHSFLNLFVHQALAPALKAINDNPQNIWSLESLASTCAMSRTKFSLLFKKISGLTVNEYLTWWRMQLAYDLLKKGQRIAQVADQVGYQSMAAFSRVFKKTYGMSPGKVSQ